MKLAVICPSEIAYRRFMPALQNIPNVHFVGIGTSSESERFDEEPHDSQMVQDVLLADRMKAKRFVEHYGGRIFASYESVVNADDVDAVYIPLPPALHFRWAKAALEAGKHVLVEKPATTTLEESRELVQSARNRGLGLHENYMFMFHDQLSSIDQIVSDGGIGSVRLYRVCFGFPRRDAHDFRYDRKLGGGSLIDAGGYTIKYADKLLGGQSCVSSAVLNYLPGIDVDMYGSGTLINNDGVSVQVGFGMDNGYKCELEIWGSEGILDTNRVLTAPAGFTPSLTITTGEGTVKKDLPCDDSFAKSIHYFMHCIEDQSTREQSYDSILRQAELIQQFRDKAGELQSDDK